MVNLRVHDEWVSECCGRGPVDEIDEHNTGRCAYCKENAVFVKEPPEVAS